MFVSAGYEPWQTHTLGRCVRSWRNWTSAQGVLHLRRGLRDHDATITRPKPRTLLC